MKEKTKKKDEENFMDLDETNESYMEDKEDLDEEIDLEEILSELELDENDDSEEETVDEAKKEDLDELFGFGKKTPVQRVGQPNYRGDDVHDILNRASDVNDNLSENFNLDSLLQEINDLEDNEEIMEVYDDEDDMMDLDEMDMYMDDEEMMGMMAKLKKEGVDVKKLKMKN
jgi:hypothetical protein